LNLKLNLKLKIQKDVESSKKLKSLKFKLKHSKLHQLL
jgi:hypothetical protein